MASRRVTVEFLGDDKNLSKVARGVDTSTRKLGDTFKRVGKAAAIGLGVGIAAATAGLVAFGKGAVEEAREAQKITAQTNAVIKSTGGIANVTADQVGNLAEKLSLKAGIDDELIQSGSNVLLTFKNIRNEVGKGNKIFDQATTTALDMSVALKTDMKSASILVGKALNDPIAGLSALSRVGVTFTDQQKKTIETLVEEGNTMKAQKIILRELNSEFGGSAAAQATAGDKAKVAWGNFQEFIGAKLLPIIDKLAVWFTVVLVPALQRFSAWFEREGVPKIKAFVQTAQEWIGRFVDFIRKHWPEISRVIKTVLTNVVEIVRGVVDLVRAYWKKFGEDILRIAKIAWDFVYRMIKNALKVIQGVINVVTGIIKGDWSQVWKGIKQIFGGVWDQIKNVLKTALKVIREIIRNAWDAVKDIVKGAWGKILDLLRWALGKVWDAIKWYLGKYRDAFKAAWDWVKDTTRRVWDGIRDVLGNAFGWVRDKIGNAIQGWRNIIGRGWDGIKRIFGFLKDGVRAIPEAFKAAKDGIGRIWEGLKKTVGTPIYYILRYAWNPLARALDNIPNVGDWSVDTGNIPHWRKGGYTGPGAKDKVAGLVHADEYVLSKDARKTLELRRPGALDFMNRTGAWPGMGYASGGRVWPAHDLIPGDNYPGHDGVDIQAPLGSTFVAAAAGRISYIGWDRGYGNAIFEVGDYGELVYGHGSRALVRQGQNVSAGQPIGIVGMTGNTSGPHVHFGFPGGTFEQAMAFLSGANVSGGIGAGLATGLYAGILGAGTATPKFTQAWADAEEKLDVMQARDGWWPIIARTLTSSMDDIAKYAGEKLRDAGAWMVDKSGVVDLVDDDAANITKAWNAVDDIDVPFIGQGGIVRARPGGTLALLGEAGRDEAVVPLDRGRPMGGETLVAELHVYLDGKQIENSQVRLKRLNGGKLAYL